MTRRRWTAGLAVMVLATSNGCALVASAFANHNSRGTACIDNPTFATFDLVLGSAGAAAILVSEDTSNGWIAAPGLLLLSGVVGAIYAGKCGARSGRGDRDFIPAGNTEPSFGDAEVDPDARQATPEEMGLGPPPPSSPVSGTKPALNLLLDKLPETPPPAPLIPCGDAPGSCPADHICEMGGSNAGLCVPTR